MDFPKFKNWSEYSVISFSAPCPYFQDGNSLYLKIHLFKSLFNYTFLIKTKLHLISGSLSLQFIHIEFSMKFL